MSNAREIASGAKFVNVTGDSMTGNLEVDGIIEIDKTGDHPALRFVEDGTNTRAYMGSGDWAINGLSDDDFGISGSSTGDLAFGTSAGQHHMRINSGGNISVPNQQDVVISKKGCLRAGNADHIFGTNAGSGVTSTTMLGCSHYFNQNFSSGRYIHLKTNHPVGASGGEYSMILFEFMGYRYSPAATIHSLFGCHPWGSNLYAQSSVNNGSYTFFVNEYVSSDSKLVLVLDAGTTGSGTYVGFTVNAYITHSGYPNLNPLAYDNDGQIKVIAATNTGSTSGAY